MGYMPAPILTGSSPITPLLVCFAVKEEAAWFKRETSGRRDVSIQVTGVGMRNAESSVRTALAAGKPAAVISAGFAGALKPELTAGTVLFDTEPGGTLEAALRNAAARPGTFFCSERIASTVADKKRLFEQTGADAVEMESGAIKEVCREQGIPFATVRVILDAADKNLPLDFNLLMNGAYQIVPRKLAVALIRSPGQIPALIRLQQESRRAAEILGQVLARAFCES